MPYQTAKLIRMDGKSCNYVVKLIVVVVVVRVADVVKVVAAMFLKLLQPF